MGGRVEPRVLEYELPGDLVAQEPLEPRDSSRLLLLSNAGIEHDAFQNLPNHLREGDLLLYNNSRVVPAGLRGRKATGGKVQVLAVEPRGEDHLCLIRGKVRAGDILHFGGGTLEVVERNGPGWLCKPGGDGMTELLRMHGEVQLPPYIHKRPANMERYQTVYAREPGSLAAPTAGLHFTGELLRRLGEKGVEMQPLSLHVGPASFLPLRSFGLGDLPPEAVSIPEGTAEAVNGAIQDGRRIVAVGTTTVKAIESKAINGVVDAGDGSSQLMISPGYAFKIPWSGMLTNFHLPGSTNLLLVAALAGVGETLGAYRTAVDMRYRFYSFGDAMLVVR